MEATKRQRWLLYVLTKEDWRNRAITKQEASKLIGELLQKKNQEVSKIKDEVIKEIRGIESRFVENLKRLQEERHNKVLIYEADLKNQPVEDGKKYVEKDFFLCGFITLKTFDKDFVRKFKKVAKKLKDESERPYWKLGEYVLSKDYYAGYTLSTPFIEGYSNGKFTLAIEALQEAIKDTAYNWYVDARLD